MNAHPQNESLAAEREMISYLLGQMTTEERTAFEERYFADEKLFTELSLVKEELFDRHARGQLSHEESARLEEQFGASATGREQLAFAQTLHQALVKSAAAPASSPQAALPAPPARAHWLASLTWWNWSWAAAAACLLVALLWQWSENRHLRGELHALQTRQAEQAQLAQQLTEELQRLRGTSAPTPAPLTPSPAVSPVPTPRLPGQAVFALQLLPTVRGENEAVVQVPAEAEGVNLQLQLNFTPAARSCQAALFTADGTPVVPTTRLTERPSATGFTLPWQIAARQLSPGEYKVNVSGHDRENNEDVTLTYRFRVERP